jgi:peptidyl-prolyl cis-trans isomerase D
MLKAIQNRDAKHNRWVKICMTVLLGLISLSMLTYLIPGMGSGTMNASPDAVASVDGQEVTIVDVQRELNKAMHGQKIPEALKGIYAKQVLDEMVFSRALEYEGPRLGLNVTPEEESERIKQLLPAAWEGGTWAKDRYEQEVQLRTGMTVPDFEKFLRDAMLKEKFHQLVTDSITVSPVQIQEEFRRRNEKVQIEYVLVKPAELASTIQPTDAELAAYYAKNAARYQIPEKRSARYALLNLALLRARTVPSDDALRAYYNSHIDEYKIENRAHVEHILFKTIGKTDAEVTEIRQRAEDALKKAKSGANFEDLAKKYSEDDATKPKGGDLGWIVEKQTVPEFEQAAFSVPKGSISDLVKTQYGFHIIKVLDRETAHTKPFEEVRSAIVPIVADTMVISEANDISNRMASAVRQSNRQSLEDLAKKFDLQLGETPAASATDPVGNIGSSPELHQALFQLRPGELSQPLGLPSGFVILTPKDVQPAHQGTLAEVHDKVVSDYQQDKSIDLAKAKAEEFAQHIKAGDPFDKAAKTLNLEVKTPEAFSRTASSVQDVGSAKLLDAAFGMQVDQVSSATQISGNWLVYRIVGHEPVKLEDLARQSEQIKQQLLQNQQTAAFEAFRAALEDRLKKEGKITIHDEAMKRLTRSS